MMFYAGVYLIYFEFGEDNEARFFHFLINIKSHKWNNHKNCLVKHSIMYV